MIKELAKSIREYKRASILAPVYVIGEVVMEAVIPFIIAKMVNQIKAGATVAIIWEYGGVLLALAMVSLLFGYLAGNEAATASAGFGKNLRQDVFYKIQDFSFSNIDRFSPSSLVTRLTTDITNVQTAYMMIVRTAIRSPLNLIFSFVMAYLMGGRMALVFLVTIPVLGIGLFLIIRKAIPLFRKGFPMYDAMNESVEENVRGMRVVKSFVREDYEDQKFDARSEDIRRIFTKAERLLALNGPLMQVCLYGVMLFVLSIGTRTIITSQGTALDVGQFSALLTYSFQILVSLMMLSMIFVMLTMAQESAERIVEVLREKSTITAPASPVTAVADGSIAFDHEICGRTGFAKAYFNIFQTFVLIIKY